MSSQAKDYSISTGNLPSINEVVAVTWVDSGVLHERTCVADNDVKCMTEITYGVVVAINEDHECLVIASGVDEDGDSVLKTGVWIPSIKDIKVYGVRVGQTQ